MTELGEALPSRVTQYGWPWKAHPLETGRRAHGGLITSCESPALLCSAGKKRLCASISRLSAGASIPLPPIRNGAAGGARAIAQAHLPIVGLRVLSFQTGTLIALTLQHSRVCPGTTKLGCLGSPRRLSWAWYRPGSHHPEPVSSSSDSGDIRSQAIAGQGRVYYPLRVCHVPVLRLSSFTHLISSSQQSRERLRAILPVIHMN